MMDDCPPNTFPLTEGGCSDTWNPCPETWTPASGDAFGCLPPAIRDDCPPGSLALADGTCSATWDCPTGWERSPDNYACRPASLATDCPEGSNPKASGGCTAPWVCAEGWRRAEDNLHCEPIYDDCPDASRPILGGGCDTLGLAECHWPPLGLPDGAVFVNAQTPTPEDADGSLEHPWVTLEQALTSGASTIALAAGDYVPAGPWPTDLTLVGECAVNTRLVGLVTLEADATLRDLTIDASAAANGVHLVSGRALLTRVQIIGAFKDGVVVEGGELEGENLRIADPEGHGLVISAGMASCVGCLVERASTASARVIGATLSLTDTTLQDAEPSLDVGRGFGVWATDNAVVDLKDVQILKAYSGGIWNSNSTLTIQGVTITDVKPKGDGLAGVGLSVVGPQNTVSTADVNDLYIAHVQRFGLHIQGSKVQWASRRVVVRDVTPDRPVAADKEDSQGYGYGVFVFLAAHASFHDLVIEDVVHLGLNVFGVENLELTRGTIRKVGPNNIGTGIGLRASNDTTTLNDVLVEDNASHGIIIASERPDARVTLTDVIARGHGSHPNLNLEEGGQDGGGLSVTSTSSEGRLAVELTDVILDNNEMVGLLVSGPMDITAERLTITRTSSPQEGPSATGLIVSNDVRLDWVDGWMADNSFVAIYATDQVNTNNIVPILGAPVVINARRLAVVDTHPSEFGGQAVGALLVDAGNIHLNQALFSGNAHGGLFVSSPDAELFGSEVLVQDTSAIIQPAQNPGAEPAEESTDAPNDVPPTSGIGAAVSGGATLELERSILRRNHMMGLSAYAPKTVARVHNTRVCEIPGAPMISNNSVGIIAVEGAGVEMDQVRISSNAGLGLMCDTQGTATATRLVVENTALDTSKAHGHGIYLGPGGTLEGQDVRLANNAVAGALVSGTLNLTNGESVLNRVGLLKNGSPRLTLKNFRVAENMDASLTCETIDCDVDVANSDPTVIDD